MIGGHGSPYDRGDSDAHYGRRPSPHKWTGKDSRSRDDNLTEAEAAEYWRGYDENPSDKKDWRE